MQVINTDFLDKENILFMIRRATSMAKGLSRPQQATKRTGVLLFAKPSTRTKASFAQAFRLMGVQVFDLPLDSSSMQKGESLTDTLDALEILRYDIAIVRTDTDLREVYRSSQNVPSIHLVNAGDALSHPTQALADLGALFSVFHDVRGMKFNFRGDVGRSRVFNSTASLLDRLGGIIETNVPVQDDQVVYQIRQQVEQGRKWADDEYRDKFGLVESVPVTAIMHAGPVQVGIDISPDNLDRQCSLVRTQVRYGLWTRVALLEYLCRKEAIYVYS
jgi:aspartate carbamoyltransferase catalytic subunit